MTEYLKKENINSQYIIKAIAVYVKLKIIAILWIILGLFIRTPSTTGHGPP